MKWLLLAPLPASPRTSDMKDVPHQGVQKNIGDHTGHTSPYESLRRRRVAGGSHQLAVDPGGDTGGEEQSNYPVRHDTGSILKHKLLGQGRQGSMVGLGRHIRAVPEFLDRVEGNQMNMRVRHVNANNLFANISRLQNLT